MPKNPRARREFIKRIGHCEIPNCTENNLNRLTIDHKIPLSKGGLDEMDNWQVLCYKHNQSKSNKLDAEICSGHIIERMSKGEAVVGKISFGWNSKGTFSIVAQQGTKDILLNLRGEEAQKLKEFINKVV